MASSKVEARACRHLTLAKPDAYSRSLPKDEVLKWRINLSVRWHPMSIELEIQIIKAFLTPTIGFLTSKKGRMKLLDKLYHFDDFDPTCIVELSAACNSANGLIAELRRRGATDEVYVMSVAEELDGVSGPIEDVIQEVFESVEGTIVSCLPGTLAYYEGEAPNNRFILHRPELCEGGHNASHPV
jgi:hypothetical protein